MNKKLEELLLCGLLLVLVPGMAVIGWAQFPPQGYGGLQITRATYGYGDRVRDVTAILNSQIQNNRLVMEVNNRNLGGDPAEGRPKTLTVWFIHNGRSLQTSIPENTTLNLGGAAAGLRILRAEYGAGSRLMDVTTRLNAQAQNGALALRVTNDTMGGDPADDQRKNLIVWYAYDGHVSRVVVNEKDVLELPGNQPYYPGNLQIMRAQYGADYRYRDVTDLLSSQIQNDTLNLQITNATMGGDPAEDKRKILAVSYLYQGEIGRIVVNEKEYLSLPGNTANPYADNSASLEILRARWGAAGGNSDVTALIASRLQGGQLQLPVTRDTMGGDPAPGQVKLLRVTYLWQGLRYETNVPENATLILP